MAGTDFANISRREYAEVTAYGVVLQILGLVVEKLDVAANALPNRYARFEVRFSIAGSVAKGVGLPRCPHMSTTARTCLCFVDLEVLFSVRVGHVHFRLRSE